MTINPLPDTFPRTPLKQPLQIWLLSDIHTQNIRMDQQLIRTLRHACKNNSSPFSVSFVSMTMFSMRFSQTIVQKSVTVSSIGPWVAMKALFRRKPFIQRNKVKTNYQRLCETSRVWMGFKFGICSGCEKKEPPTVFNIWPLTPCFSHG